LFSALTTSNPIASIFNILAEITTAADITFIKRRLISLIAGDPIARMTIDKYI
jgi:hypothetical protein